MPNLPCLLTRAVIAGATGGVMTGGHVCTKALERRASGTSREWNRPNHLSLAYRGMKDGVLPLAQRRDGPGDRGYRPNNQWRVPP